MRTISIKHSKVYHNRGTKDKNGIACKFIVSQLLGLDSNLSLAEVVTDTDETYSVRLRVMGSDVGLRISNSSTSLYLSAGVWKSDGTFVEAPNNSVSASSWFGYYYGWNTPEESWYPDIRVSVVGIDGVLTYIVFSTSENTNVPCMYYGTFTSTAYTEPEYCAGVAEKNLSATYPALPVIPFSSALPNVIKDKTNDNYEKVSFSSFTAFDGFTRAGYQYAFLPRAYYGISTNKGFLNIKWGGLYSLYVLYGQNGVVSTLTGETVTINGSAILSGGQILIAN